MSKPETQPPEAAKPRRASGAKVEGANQPVRHSAAVHAATPLEVPSPPPAPDDHDGWRVYWQARGQSWRTEPTIDEKRQALLAERRNRKADIQKGIYPFTDIEPKLTRADIEWLLETHEDSGRRGPLDWEESRQKSRKGLDLRGAVLSGVDLHGLPLAGLRGGLAIDERTGAIYAQRQMAAIHLERADLTDTHLEGAILVRAHLEEANLRRAKLQNASLILAHLEGASLRAAHLEGAYLGEAHLGGKDLHDTDSDMLVDCFGQDATKLDPAHLRFAFLDEATNLDSSKWGDERYGYAMVLDVRWGGANLAMVNWAPVKMLGEEWRVHHLKAPSSVQERYECIRGYRWAIRANRQLANAFRSQGMSEEGDYFSYRALNLQRQIRWRHAYWGLTGRLRADPSQPQQDAEEPHNLPERLKQRQRIQYLGEYVFSLFLDALAGYGYRPLRSLIVYLLTLLCFMGLYLLNSHFVAPHLTWDQALVLSVSSFHGRGFFAQDISLGSAYARLAAAEAVIGLLIEISFIATFTQRFFSR